ncbi:MAG: hypothetical protein JNM62_01475 [Flavobacteriales bacterium]|nr:hypothetical protein [Flavobacteriales bacterium]
MRRVWLLTAVAALAGAALGWSYWYYFGCTNGCAITSSPLNSSLYGALMGGLLLHTFKRSPSATNPDQL